MFVSLSGQSGQSVLLLNVTSFDSEKDKGEGGGGVYMYLICVRGCMCGWMGE